MYRHFGGEGFVAGGGENDGAAKGALFADESEDVLAIGKDGRIGGDLVKFS